MAPTVVVIRLPKVADTTEQLRGSDWLVSASMKAPLPNFRDVAQVMTETQNSGAISNVAPQNQRASETK